MLVVPCYEEPLFLGDMRWIGAPEDFERFRSHVIALQEHTPPTIVRRKETMYKCLFDRIFVMRDAHVHVMCALPHCTALGCSKLGGGS